MKVIGICEGYELQRLVIILGRLVWLVSMKPSVNVATKNKNIVS